MSSYWDRPVLAGEVLVVEDDEDVAGLLISHLTAFGCAVRSAATAEVGLELALALPPDLAIIDLRLPGMDGRELIRALRGDVRTRGARLVLTSVVDLEVLVDLRTGCGCDAILPKPFSRRQVADVIAPLLNGVV